MPDNNTGPSDGSNGSKNGSRERSSSNEVSTLDRRSVIKASTVGLAAALAGCSGGGGDGDGGGDGGGGGDSGGDGGAGTMTQAQGGSDFSDVSLSFWDMAYFPESRFAAQVIETWYERWAAATGATVNFAQINESQIVERFRSNRQPHMIVGEPSLVAQLLGGDLVYGYSEVQDGFPDYYDELLDGGRKLDQSIWRGWEEEAYSITITAKPYAPFLGNMRFFEETDGLDPDEDFPPENYDQLVEVATTLDANPDVDVGYQPYGTDSDVFDVQYYQWGTAAGGADGNTFGEDWSTVNWNNDTWKEWFTKNIEMYSKHGLGTEGTPGMSDEAGMGLMVQERVALDYVASGSQATMYDRAPDLFEDGTFKYGKPWGGDTNTYANIFQDGAFFPKRPDNKDEATWTRSRNASFDMIQYLMDPENELINDEIYNTLAIHPAWTAALDNLIESDMTEAGGWNDVTLSMLKDTFSEGVPYQKEAHPFNGAELNRTIYDANKQDMWSGNRPVPDVLEDMAEEAQRELDGMNPGGDWIV